MRRRCQSWAAALVAVVGCEQPPANFDPPDEGSSSDAAELPEPPDVDGDSSGGSAPGTTTGDDDPGTTGTDDPEGEESSSTGEPPVEPPSALGCSGRDDLLLCEDFESGELDPSRWSLVEQEGAQVSVTDELTVHGTHALKVSLPVAGGARGGIVTPDDTVFPLAPNHFFGRGFIHVTPSVPTSHSLLLFAEGTLSGRKVRYRLDSNNTRLNSRYVDPGLDVHGGLKKLSDYQLPSNVWVCIEWEYDGELDEMRYWIDGDLLAEAVVTSDEDPPWIAPVFQRFEIGFRTFQAADEPASVYWDEIALADQRIGCGD